MHRGRKNYERAALCARYSIRTTRKHVEMTRGKRDAENQQASSSGTATYLASALVW